MQDIERLRISQQVRERFLLPVFEGDKIAALRNFNLAYVGSGSKASDRRARRVRCMSAVPLIAPELVRCSDSTKSATTGLMQCSKTGALFDHLVGNGEQPWWKAEAECFCGLQIDHELELT
jgi:hypothetical protein